MGLNSEYKDSWGFVAKEQDQMGSADGKLQRGDIKDREFLTKLTQQDSC